MRIIRLINDAQINETDFNNIVEAVKYFTPKVVQAWRLPDVQIEANGIIGDTDWVIYVSEKNRHVGAAGYHTVYKGLPVAWCSPKASGRLYGTYIKPLSVKGKLIHKAIYTSGLIGTICHELAEMLIDPVIQTISSKDAKGREWLVEVCDHVFGSFDVITINGKNCVLPDVTTPSFYNLDGAAPYSLFNAPVAPFIMTPKGYGYYVSGNKLVRL